MSVIHLLARKGDQQPTAFRHLGGGVHLTGWWKLSEAEAKELVGGNVHLHETKADVSWLGGQITNYELADPGSTDAGRIGLHFRPSPEGRDKAWDWGKNKPNMRAEMSLVCP
jgi:hypothetical protein